MRILLTISLIFNFSVLFAQDTVSKKPSLPRQRIGTHKIIIYYNNGQVKTYIREESFLRKGKIITYDSLGNTLSKGKIKFRRKHKTWRFYSNDSIEKVKYRYGVARNKLDSNSNYKYSSLVEYGHGCNYFNYSDKYKIMPLCLGCVVTTGLIIQTSIHNTKVYLLKSLRYGPFWKRKMNNNQ